MKFSRTLIATALLAGTLSAAAQELLRATTSWDGGAITYPQGQPEITAVILKIDAGETAPFHCHPVPTLGYVLRGKVEVETASGEKVILNEGDPAVEVMRTVHRGRAIDGPVEILVFYAGAESIPTTVLPENDPHSTYCDPG